MRNNDAALLFNIAETPGNTVQVTGSDFVVNVNYINLADLATQTLVLKAISTADPTVT